MSSVRRRPSDSVSRDDDNPRPHKRQRTNESHNPSLPSSPLTDVPSSQSIPVPTSAPTSPSPSRHTVSSLSDIPPEILLVNLPSLLIHPPNHPLHVQSLYLSLLALRKCLNLPRTHPGVSLTADIECRAWTGLAEVGMRVIAGGLSQNEDIGWAQGIEAEVEKAAAKGLHIANAHPSLRLYRPHLTIISATLATLQHNIKYARNLVKKLLGTFSQSQGETWPPHVEYGVHLAYIDLLVHNPIPSSKSSRLDINSNQQDTYTALSAIQTLADLASTSSNAPSVSGVSFAQSPRSSPTKATLDGESYRPSNSSPNSLWSSSSTPLNGHARVVLLTHVLRLRVHVAAGMWSEVGDALREAERGLNLVFETTGAPEPLKATTNTSDEKLDSDATPKASKISPSATQTSSVTTYVETDDPFLVSLIVHTLIIGVLYHTYAGDAQKSYARLAVLHTTMDKVLVDHNSDESDDGIISISFDSYHSKMYIRTTHPRVLYALGFLVSSTVKRDPIGRKPKRKVFAVEGLARWEREMRSGEFARHMQLPAYANLDDLAQLESRMAKIKADLLSELVGVSILRGEFDAAEHNLNLLIAHTRTYDIFLAYSARITLHHAHLAHALGQADRAERCYDVAYHLANPSSLHGKKSSTKKCAAVEQDERMLGGDSEFVAVAALAGKVGLKLGLSITEIWSGDVADTEEVDEPVVGKDRCNASGTAKEEEGEEHLSWRAELTALGNQAVAESRGMGGTLEAIGQILEACFSKEIIKAKQHLKQALSKATRAQDNHLRALILAMISAHYFHVSADHARTMLTTCDQLAAGLGAASVKPKAGDARESLGTKPEAGGEIGNAPLRLWVGEKFVELYNRTEQPELAKKQSQLNARLTKAVRQLAARGQSQ